MKRPDAFPRLMRALADAGRFAYGSMPVTVSGAALAQVAAGRRSVTGSPNLSQGDHAHRMAQALTYALRNPGARAELREWLDSFEPPKEDA